MRKKLFSLLMALLMVVSILPTSGLTVYAEDSQDDSNVEVTTIYEEESDDLEVIEDDESLELTIEIDQEETSDIEDVEEIQETQEINEPALTNSSMRIGDLGGISILSITPPSSVNISGTNTLSIATGVLYEFTTNDHIEVTGDDGYEYRAVPVSVTGNGVSYTFNHVDGEDDYPSNFTPASTDSGKTYTIKYAAQYLDTDDDTWKDAPNVSNFTVTVAVQGATQHDNIVGDGQIKEELTADDAYIKSLSVNKTVTGTGPWDSDDDPGNDSSATNYIVRSFDSITYTVGYGMNVYTSGIAYKNGYAYFEATLPVDKGKAYWDTGSMGWLAEDGDTISNGGHHWEVITNADGSQTLKGCQKIETSPGNTSAIPGSGTATFAVKVMAANNGETIQPTFKAWLENNETGDSCSTHNRNEIVTCVAPEVKVSAAPSYNVQLNKVGDGHVSTSGTFDFSTGNDKALNKDAGSVKGRRIAYGITLQLYNSQVDKGLKGIEMPSGPITFDLNFSAVYKPDSGSNVDLTAGDNYVPLVWSYEGNRMGTTQEDGRSVSPDFNFANVAAPLNSSGRSGQYLDIFADTNANKWNRCWNGGSWAASQNGNTVTFTVSDYEINPYWFPSSDIGTYQQRYYQRNDGFLNIGCFSAGELYVIVPFTENSVDLTNKYGNGTIELQVKDVNLKATSVTNQIQQDKTNTNDAQPNTTDDSDTRTVYLSAPGSFKNRIFYKQTSEIYSSLASEVDVNGKTDFLLNGQDAMAIGGKVAIPWRPVWFSRGEASNYMVGVDSLMLFDDEALDIISAENQLNTYNGVDQIGATDPILLYAAKQDGTGWTDDDEMNNAKIENLVYYESIDALKADGKTCIGVLRQYRSATTEGMAISVTYIGSHAEFDITKDIEKAGKVYQTIVKSNLWIAGEVSEVPPTIMDVQNGTAQLDDYNNNKHLDNWMERSYEKAYYDASGYAGGHVGDYNIGDSLYLVVYKSQIVKTTAQRNDADTDYKQVYDLDKSQYIVDYKLTPSMIVEEGVTWNEKTQMTITDTLPSGLTYIPQSAVYGGTYNVNTTGNRAGSVTGGEALEPDVVVNADGTTTLTWVIDNVTVEKDMTPIYFKAQIDPATGNNEGFTNQSTIATTEDNRVKNVNNGNKSDYGITTLRNLLISVAKKADHEFYDVNSPMTWTITWSNNTSSDLSDQVLMDSMPISGGTHGSKFNGTYHIKSIIPIPSAGFDFHDYKVYYSTDEASGALLAKDVTAQGIRDSVTANAPANGSGGVTWKQAPAPDATTGEIDGPFETDTVHSWVVIGPMGASKQVQAKLTIKPENNKSGDVYVNTGSVADVYITSNTYVVSRILRGTTWVDANRDGERQNSETLLSGVTVTLKDASGNTVNDLSGNTCEKTTGSDGTYEFTNLPAGDFKVVFTSSSGVDLGEYYLTEKETSGVGATVNSKASATDTDGKGESAEITGINMPATSEIHASPYVVRYQDAGFYQVSGVQVSKTITGNALTNAESTKDYEFTFNVEVPSGGFEGPYNYEKTTASASTTGTIVSGDSFNLKDGETIKFNNLSPNSKVTISETKEDAMLTSYKIDDGTTTYSLSSEVTTVANEIKKIAYINDHSTTELSVTKNWSDQSNASNSRPDSISFKLYYGSGTEVSDVTPTESGSGNSFTYTFSDLPKYSSDGTELVYYVVENAVDGYSTSYSNTGTNASETTRAYNGGTITNTLDNPDTVDLVGTKVWKDNSNKAKKRPTSITLVLANDKGLSTNGYNPTWTNKDTDNWTFTYSGLPRYTDDGQEVTWSISEQVVEGYESEQSSDGLTITNTYPNPVIVNPPVKKVVKGTNNNDTFTYTLKPISNTAGITVSEMPMPEGSANGQKQITKPGAGEYEFGEFELLVPGTYIYQISEEVGTLDYEYDTSTYTVTYVATANGNTLKATTTITKDGEAADDVVFTNKYKGTPIASVSKTVDKTEVREGDLLTYTITVKNTGDGVLENYDTWDILPSQLTYQSDDSNGVYSVTSDGRERIDWTVTKLESGESKSFKLVTKVKECREGDSIRNVAYIKDPTGDVKSAYDASDDATTTVLGVYDEDLEADKAETNGAKTGDEAPIGAAMGIFGAALAGLAITARRRRRKVE